MIKKIIDFIISVFTYTEDNKSVIEPTENVIKQPEIQKEVYVMLTNKERQTYLKKLGLYTKSIDNIRGSGQKKAEKIFNIIFLNIHNDVYTEATDKLLRDIYESYCKDPYMVDSDWKYFKSFKKSEFKCKCKGKGCNGYPSKIHMRIVMLVQYIRNRIKAPYTLTSGLRCEYHNEKVGGVKKSKHKIGGGADGRGEGKTADELMKIAKEVPFLNYTYQCGSKEIHTDVKM